MFFIDGLNVFWEWGTFRYRWSPPKKTWAWTLSTNSTYRVGVGISRHLTSFHSGSEGYNSIIKRLSMDQRILFPYMIYSRTKRAPLPGSLLSFPTYVILETNFRNKHVVFLSDVMKFPLDIPDILHSQECEVTLTLIFDLQAPISNQFIFESKSKFVPNMK